MIIEKVKGKNNKGFYCICKCDVCGKTFEGPAYRFKNSKHQYCSRLCSWPYYKSEEFSKTMSLAEIGVKRLGVKRSIETRKKIGLAKQGSKHWNWNGGKIIKIGYILIKNPNHPFANSKGYVREHRLVMEKYLGRGLLPKEIIHHINGDKKDNRIENLMLFANKGEHIIFHSQIKKSLLLKAQF